VAKKIIRTQLLKFEFVEIRAIRGKTKSHDFTKIIREFVAEKNLV
jgi:hypothetical protein